MLRRPIGLVVAALALVLVMSQVSTATQKGGDKEKIHDGKVLKSGDGQLVMTDIKGENKHTLKVPATAKITCDGKECKLDELKSGLVIQVTTRGEDQVVVRIAARTDKK